MLVLPATAKLCLQKAKAEAKMACLNVVCGVFHVEHKAADPASHADTCLLIVICASIQKRARGCAGNAAPVKGVYVCPPLRPASELGGLSVKKGGKSRGEGRRAEEGDESFMGC